MDDDLDILGNDLLPEYIAEIKNTEENRAKCPGMHKQDNRMKVFRDVHEPIIERATWEKVQSKRGNTRKRTTRTSSEGVKNIFSGFLICPDCGGNLNFHFNQGNHDIQYFNCANNNKARKTCTATHYIRADFLEQIMLREIRRLTAFASLHEKEFVKMVSGFSEQAEISDVKRKEKELNRLTVRNKEIDILYERLYEDNASGKVTGRSDWT